MGRRAAHMGDKLHPALMGVDRHHACRLADNGDAGRHPRSLEKGRHSLRPETAKLLVKGEGEIERLAELAGTGLEFRGHGQRHGKKSLHIDSAAPVKPPVRAAKAERVALPASGIGGHHIQMAGQQDATRCLRPDPCQKIEPLAVLMRVPPAGDAVRAKPLFDIADNIAVRAEADAGEADKAGEQVDAALTKRVRAGAHVSTT